MNAWKGFIYFTVRCLSLCGMLAVAPVSWGFDPQLAPFAASLNGRTLDNAIGFQPILPDQLIQFTFADDQNYELIVGDQRQQSQQRRIDWRTPAQPGYLPITLVQRATNARIELQIFVMVPATEIKQGKLKGYRIGDYPPARNGLQSYAAPIGYIEVQANMRDLKISPHFTLGQFLCKQASGYPKFVVLRPRLLQKLELLLQDINAQGIATDSLVVMSGYRTPYYNRAIGNVSASRHLYGGAADVYVDVAPKDGVMDDLNGDGKVNLQDATYLYQRADSLVKRTGRKDLVGGVGRYNSNSAHGPFVHVDVRGSRARWGLD